MTDDMANPQRRSDDPDDGRSHVIQNAVESTGLKVFARVVLPTLLAAIGFFLLRTLSSVEEGQKTSARAIAAQGIDIGQVKSDVRNINTRLDEGVIRQVNANTQNLADHEKRIQLIERTVRTP